MKVIKVHDAETGDELQMLSVDAHEAVRNDPERYSFQRRGTSAKAAVKAAKKARGKSAKPHTGKAPKTPKKSKVKPAGEGQGIAETRTAEV